MRSECAHVLLERPLRDELDDGDVADLADTVASVLGLLVVVRAGEKGISARKRSKEERDALVVLVVEDDGVRAGGRSAIVEKAERRRLTSSS